MSNVGGNGVAQYAVTEAERLILDERRRQIAAEGHSIEHDDKHVSGELALAAACYLDAAGKQATASLPQNWRGGATGGVHPRWPWDRQFWKPKDELRNAVIGAALAAAHVERLLRQADKPAQLATPKPPSRFTSEQIDKIRLAFVARRWLVSSDDVAQSLAEGLAEAEAGDEFDQTFHRPV